MTDIKIAELTSETLAPLDESNSRNSDYPFSYSKSKRPLSELFGKYKDDPVFEEVWAEILRKHNEETVEE